ncbi:MAG TPA: hypothetical protein VEA36_01655 [Candidatus Paceibacterota bacterium]|nr:hypothetical protein [Candidatus Paceibacterota bacterium]
MTGVQRDPHIDMVAFISANWGWGAYVSAFLLLGVLVVLAKQPEFSRRRRPKSARRWKTKRVIEINGSFPDRKRGNGGVSVSAADRRIEYL